MLGVQYPDTPDSPARKCVAVTPGPTNLTYEPKALFIGGAGTVVVIAIDDTVPVTFTVPAGFILPVKALNVGAASTATNIIALV